MFHYLFVHILTISEFLCHPHPRNSNSFSSNLCCPEPKFPKMPTTQHTLSIKAPKRGYHLITNQILSTIHSDLSKISQGLCHIFIQHTSAGLTINENCDSDVRHDMEQTMNRIVPQNQSYYRHTAEGPDDFPAHMKSSIIGCEVTVPITKGELGLGTWQGVYLCEFRDRPTTRNVIITLMG
mmetsp:Transcript_270/g.917  ORF Transcript_270/g.917 Transcript_270/m.917 type:complete len:181 (-) Transcript_270:153-695(-)